MKPRENYNRFKQITKFIANAISWTVLVILLLIAGFLVYYYIANKVYASKGEKYEPAVGLYTIVSPSMTPNLNVYDVIVNVKVKNVDDIKVGDIITFISTSSISKGLTITHRVVAIVETAEGKEFKTQGDNNLTPDSATVPFRNVLGKVLIRIPQLGRVQYFLASSYGWLLIVVIPALFIIVSDVLKILKLTGAKKKVNAALTTEEENNKRIEQKKEEIKETLKKRYAVDRNNNEPDPLVTNKKLTRVTSGETKKIKIKNKTNSNSEIPKKEEKETGLGIELPKLKKDNKPKNRKRKKK